MRIKFYLALFCDLIFPPRCGYCGEFLPVGDKRSPLCKACAGKWELAKISCREKCHGQPVTVYDRSLAQRERGGIALYSVTYHPGEAENIENTLIIRLKYKGDGEIVKLFALTLADVIAENLPEHAKGGALHGDTVISWIPRRRESVAKYGFDHMELVAKELSKLLDIPAYALLKRRFFGVEQKRLTQDERLQNAHSMMYPSERHSPEGKHVILIDDVITTGASIGAASDILLQSKAVQVIPVLIARSSRSID